MGVGVVVGIAVGGGEPDRDLVAGGDRHAAELGRAVAVRRKNQTGGEKRSSSSTADGDQRAIRAQPPYCSGWLRERERRERDRLARRLVARDDHQREHVVELGCVERSPVDVAVGDRRQHVLARTLAPLGVVGAAERAQLVGPGRAERLVAVLVPLAVVGELADVVGLGVDQQPVAELDQPRKLLVGKAENAAEDANRDRRRELLDEVELALASAASSREAISSRSQSP